jgi:hypothetical protein
MTDNMNSPYHHVAKIDDQRSSFQKELFQIASGDEKPVSDKSPMLPEKQESVSEMEPISKIDVPQDWTKEVNEEGFGRTAKSVSFTAPDSAGVELALYDRGFPIAKSESENFRAVLDKDLHTLDPAELGSLKEQVLGTIGDGSAFDIHHAETKMVNGKKVLAVEGDWKEGGKRFYGIFIPKDESMRQIQEVYFEGMEPHFSQNRPQALKSMESIKWK